MHIALKDSNSLKFAAEKKVLLGRQAAVAAMLNQFGIYPLKAAR